MALVASLLLLALFPSISVAQTSPSICGQIHPAGYDETKAFQDCCMAFDGKTDTIGGVDYKYHCNSYMKVAAKAKALDAGTCALACSNDPTCKGATWDSRKSNKAKQCLFLTVEPLADYLAMEVVSSSPKPPDCTSQVNAAVAATQATDQANCQAQLTAANTACDGKVTTAVTAANTACDGRINDQKRICQEEITQTQNAKTCRRRPFAYKKQGRRIVQYNGCGNTKSSGLRFIRLLYGIDSMVKCGDMCEQTSGCGTAFFTDFGDECAMYGGYATGADLEPDDSWETIVLQTF